MDTLGSAFCFRICLLSKLRDIYEVNDYDFEKKDISMIWITTDVTS